jgi:hypothetical protein
MISEIQTFSTNAGLSKPTLGCDAEDDSLRTLAERAHPHPRRDQTVSSMASRAPRVHQSTTRAERLSSGQERISSAATGGEVLHSMCPTQMSPYVRP